jgi:hypothetical protein
MIDYKLWVVLLFIILLIIIMIREVYMLKEHVTEQLQDIHTNIVSTTDNINNNFNKCISQIKGISTDNIQQLRKITLLNHQPIAKMSNHYTETDESDMHSNINHLSDARNTKIFENNHELYMSETTKKTTDTHDIQEIHDEHDILESKQTPFNIPVYKKIEILPEINIPLYNSKNINNQNIQEIHERDIEKEPELHISTDSSDSLYSQDNNPDHEFDIYCINDLISSIDITNGMGKLFNFDNHTITNVGGNTNIHHITSNPIIIVDNASDDVKNNSNNNKNINIYIEDVSDSSTSTNTSITQSPKSENHEQTNQINSLEELLNDDQSDKHVENIQPKKRKTKNTKNTKIDKLNMQLTKLDDNLVISGDEGYSSSSPEQIPDSNILDKTKDETEVEVKSHYSRTSRLSIVTNPELEKKNDFTLEPISSYNIQQLKQLCKTHHINITDYTNGTEKKRRVFNKFELYNKLKEKLNKNF